MSPDRPARKVEALVLCIDRDDDLGRKASVRGPVIGEDENFKAAKALGMADPEDSDLNAVLAAIKLKRESEHLYNGVEVVTLTGDKDVGVKSDQKIVSQLESVLAMFSPKGVIFVSDGNEDETIMPIIQSYTKILSLRTITIKQSRQLEGAYFKLQEFFGRVGDNPRQAKMMFGLPGLLILSIVILSLLGVPIVQVLIALIGFYLIAKGFGYEEQLFSGLDELRGSLLEGKVIKIFNAIAVAILVLSLITAYLQLQKSLTNIYIRPGLAVNPTDMSEAISTQPLLSLNFALFSGTGTHFASLDLILIAVTLVALGLITHNFIIKNYLRIKRYLYVMIVAIIVKYLADNIYWAIIFLQKSSTPVQAESFDPVQNLLVSVLMSFVALLVVHYLMKVIFFDYIARKKQLEKTYLGKGVFSKKGKEIGKVTKVVIRGNELVGVNVKKRHYSVENMHIDGTHLVINEEPKVEKENGEKNGEKE